MKYHQDSIRAVLNAMYRYGFSHCSINGDGNFVMSQELDRGYIVINISYIPYEDGLAIGVGDLPFIYCNVMPSYIRNQMQLLDFAQREVIQALGDVLNTSI